MKIVSLASGSKGNAYFLEAGNTKVLIDCGLSLKKLEERLQNIGESASNIDYVLISHEHSDHIQGLEAFYKKYKKPIYSNYMSAEYIVKLKPSLDGHIFTFSSETFKVGDVEVLPIQVSHDSVYCTAFKLSYGDNNVAIVTDIGVFENSLYDLLCGCKVIYIESNHDEVMLKNCAYPYIIKKRIASDLGHLSNLDCARAIINLYKSGTKFFVLSHISENSNTYEKAYITIANFLLENGVDADKDLTIRFAHQDKVGNNFILGD